VLAFLAGFSERWVFNLFSGLLKPERGIDEKKG